MKVQPFLNNQVTFRYFSVGNLNKTPSTLKGSNKYIVVVLIVRIHRIHSLHDFFDEQGSL
jgi:hypothetical protein